jgi:hypothetical protein
MNEQQLDAVKQALYGLVMLVNIEKAKPWQVELFDKTVDNLLSIISQDALDKKAENARELGLTYDDAPAPVQSAERGEPVAWMDVDENGAMSSLRYWSEPDNRHEVALYTTPPIVATPLAAQKPWVGLTDNEIALIHADYPHPQGFARAIEAKLKAKNERKEKNT